MNANVATVVLISAKAEWQAVLEMFPAVETQSSPLGSWFIIPISGQPVLFFHGGWGKIAAAASTQYVIDRWSPRLLLNLGTCGGFAGEIERGTVVLVDRTIVYDIIEQMGDYDEHIAFYSTSIDLSWLDRNLEGRPYPQAVEREVLVSADRDLLVEEVPQLKARYGARAGDWESGAIAFVAARNETRLLILRGVTDLVGPAGGEAYGDLNYFSTATAGVMRCLLAALPDWIALGSV